MTRQLVKLGLFAALGLALGLMFRWFYLDQMATTWAQLTSTFNG